MLYKEASSLAIIIGHLAFDSPQMEHVFVPLN